MWKSNGRKNDLIMGDFYIFLIINIRLENQIIEAKWKV